MLPLLTLGCRVHAVETSGTTLVITTQTTVFALTSFLLYPPVCAHSTFAEPLPEVAARAAQRPPRLTQDTYAHLLSVRTWSQRSVHRLTRP